MSQHIEGAAPPKRQRKTTKPPHLVAVLAPEPVQAVQGEEFLTPTAPIGADVDDLDDRPAMTPRLAGRERARIEREAVAIMNDTHAAVRVGGNVVVVAEDGEGFSLTTFRALSDWLACKPLHVPEMDEKAGKVRMKRVDRAMLWRGHPDRRNVRELRYAPGADLGPDVFNLWRAWGLQPVHDDGEAAAPILAHIRDLWCGGDDRLNRWVLAWFAQMVQQPTSKPGTALVLRGEEGTGKGIIAGQLMRRIIGSSFVQILHPGQVTGRFNSVWQSKLFAFCDESFWAGDKASEGVLKGLISEPKIVLELKGKEAFELDNLARLLFATNNAWAVPAGPTARRFCVLDTSSAMRGDREYFARLSACVEGEGAASFFGFLLNYDIDGVDLRTPPVTGGLLAQKVLSLDSVPAWWRERLWAGFVDNPNHTDSSLDLHDSSSAWPSSITCKALFASYAAYCKRSAVRFPEGEEGMARRLRELASLERKRAPRDSEGRRPWVYAFKGDGVSMLHALRGEFEKWIGGALPWEGDDQADRDHDDDQADHGQAVQEGGPVDGCPF